MSADTSRALPARAALEAGARIINDVRGLTADPGLARAVAESGAGLIVMASERGGHEDSAPIATVLELLAESLTLAAQAGIAAERVVVDPGIGFFRRRGIPWYEWDCAVLAALLRAAGARPSRVRGGVPEVVHRSALPAGRRSRGPAAGLDRRRHRRRPGRGAPDPCP